MRWMLQVVSQSKIFFEFRGYCFCVLISYRSMSPNLIGLKGLIFTFFLSKCLLAQSWIKELKDKLKGPLCGTTWSWFLQSWHGRWMLISVPDAPLLIHVPVHACREVGGGLRARASDHTYRKPKQVSGRMVPVSKTWIFRTAQCLFGYTNENVFTIELCKDLHKYVW